MRTYPIQNFKHGLVNSVEEQSIPYGALSDNLNWVTKGDKIEISRRYSLIGEEDNTIAETQIHVAKKADGTDVLFKRAGEKLYYLASDDSWDEIGTDLFANIPEGEMVSFSNYSPLSGNQVFVCSPSTSLYKILVSHPTSYVDLYDSTYNFKGNITIKRNRMYLWNRISDKTAVYISKIDTLPYVTETDEVLATGDNTKKAYSGTLAFKAGSAKRTCFAISMRTDDDTPETFTEDLAGNLTGSLGGTGTINYTSGAYSVTLKNNLGTGKKLYATYNYENTNIDGITDFTFSTPREAGEGAIIRQDDQTEGIQNILTYNDRDYVFHKNKTFTIEMGEDDLGLYNKIFRELVGIPNPKAAVATGEGVYYVDVNNPNTPSFRILTFDIVANEVVPKSISDKLDLKFYDFTDSVVFQWGEYVIFSCRDENSLANNVIFMYNKRIKCFDKLDFYAKELKSYNGKLISSDSTSSNVYQLFKGFLDQGEAPCKNYVIGNRTDFKLSRLKKIKKVVIEGDISDEQQLDIYMSTDNSVYELVGSITGSGSYVISSSEYRVGDEMVGDSEIAGPLEPEEYINASHYKTEIKLNLPKFNNINYKLVASGIGYVSVTLLEYWDLRYKSFKLPTKYRNI